MRVSLTDFTAADAVLVHRWFNTPQVIEGLVEYRESFDDEDARDWVDRAMERAGHDRKWSGIPRCGGAGWARRRRS